MKRLFVLVVCVMLAVALALSASSCGSKKAPASKPASAPSSSPQSLAPGQNSTGLPLTVPNGFSISYFARNLQGPRVPLFDSAGNLLVSCPTAGKVVALPDKDNNGVADSQVTVVGGLNSPHGMAFLPTDPTKLYVAENNAVAIYDYDPTSMQATNRRKIIDLSTGGAHTTRTIMFAPAPNQGQLLIAVGSSQNVGVETDPQRAKILIANADGSGLRTFASGLRNSVFMAVHPTTNQVWATENGRDNLGDNLPPDEINIIQDGHNYGWPYYYGKNVLDTQFVTDPATAPPVSGMTPSYIDLQAHSAPLGLAFVTSDVGPADYKDNLIVAFHGSWNRTVPTGDKLVRIRLDEKGNYLGTEDFITGWMQPDGAYIGRPVGVIMRQDGNCYVSDDASGAVYRIAPL
jgi:glucose/arabinose dehydrogenase